MTLQRRNSGATKAIGKLEPDRLNVNGGAIALGHPVGVSGNRLILTALKELHRRNDQYALVSLCIGGGQGGAIILERAAPTADGCELPLGNASVGRSDENG